MGFYFRRGRRVREEVTEEVKGLELGKGRKTAKEVLRGGGRKPERSREGEQRGGEGRGALNYFPEKAYMKVRGGYKSGSVGSDDMKSKSSTSLPSPLPAFLSPSCLLHPSLFPPSHIRPSCISDPQGTKSISPPPLLPTCHPLSLLLTEEEGGGKRREEVVEGGGERGGRGKKRRGGREQEEGSWSVEETETESMEGRGRGSWQKMEKKGGLHTRRGEGEWGGNVRGTERREREGEYSGILGAYPNLDYLLHG
jgi:hypothetical protein